MSDIDNRLTTLETNQDVLASNQADIIDILQGPEIEQPFGAPPIREGGVVAKLDEVHARLTNGRGVTVKLPMWTKAASFLLICFQIFLTIALIYQAVHTG